MQNPTKFVSIYNTKAGSNQIIPLSTWEQLSAQPKALKNLEFMFPCDENGNRLADPAKPVIENLNGPLKTVDEVIKNHGKAKQ